MKSKEKQTNWNKWHFLLDVFNSIWPVGVASSISLIISKICGWNINWWLVIAIMLFVTCFILAFILWKRYKNKSWERIAILLPFTAKSKQQSVVDDGLVQLSGVLEFIKTEGQQFSDKIGYTFIDHENHSGKTIESKIDNELKLGTKYFFSTMGDMNESLSDYFRKEKVKKYNPVLVCTAVSSHNFKTEKNRIYRFYVRSTEEGDILAETANTLGLKKATAIVISSSYGKTIEEKFREKWQTDYGLTYTSAIEVAYGEEKDNIKKELSKRGKEDYMDKDAILVCHYGVGLTNIIQSLYELGIFDTPGKRPVLLISSTFKSDTWQKPVEKILGEIPHYIAVPKYDKSTKKGKYTDVVKNFSYFTIEKMVRTIVKISDREASTFNEAWCSEKTPKYLCFDYEEPGDAKIEMGIEKYNFI
jgi:hypothetical protein